MSAALKQAAQALRNLLDRYIHAIGNEGIECYEARAALAALEAAPQQEPVAWRAKFISDPWGQNCGCSKEHYEMVKASPDAWPDYEVEALYAAPQQAQAPGWMPIETAPKDGSLLILWWGNAATFAKWLDNSKCQYPWAGWQTPSLTPRPSGEPTHWMACTWAPCQQRMLGCGQARSIAQASFWQP